ncbi:MAG: hypothetical protein WC346_01155 [Methanogenium sp.]
MNYDIETGFYPSIVLDANFFIEGKKVDFNTLFNFTFFLSEKLNLDIFIFFNNNKTKRIISKVIEKYDFPIRMLDEEDSFFSYINLPNVKFYVKDPNIHALYKQSVLCYTIEEIKNYEMARVKI